MPGYIRLELVRSLRDGGYIVFGVVMPVVVRTARHSTRNRIEAARQARHDGWL
ncbi:hypothetical protein [Microtetraspora niveoalba]|uniref:hypothetical protein n=1 Tax=Microtetraspora niveoalba TaxID=46175 RepID=UPI000A937F6B|nr:hypothetical protein [Microtetraspora niveoalba]